MQVLLNNDQTLLWEGKNPLKVNWKFNQKDPDDPTFVRVQEFQKAHGFGTEKFKGKIWYRVDWLPWPNTIRELIANQWGIAATERADKIQDLIPWLEEKNISELGTRTVAEYWINSTAGMKIFKDNTGDNIYYREWNIISKISVDKPWEISQAKLDDEWKVTWESPKLNVCSKWASIIQSELNKLDKSIIIDGSNKENYKLTLGEGDTRVDINVGDSVYKAEWFCGKTEMIDRFKLIALAAKVKKEVWNVGVKSSWLWIVKADFNGDTNNTLMNFNEFGVYWLDQSNVGSFITYCNSLKSSEDDKYEYNVNVSS